MSKEELKKLEEEEREEIAHRKLEMEKKVHRELILKREMMIAH